MTPAELHRNVATAIENSRPCPRIPECKAYLARKMKCPECPHGEDWDKSAKAAIVAMLNGIREPSEAMIIAGNNSGDWGPGVSLRGEDAGPETCWQAMLDALKKEQTP